MFNLNANKIMTFQEQLENSLRNRLELKINDNRSTMLSVKWDPDCTKVSVHRMFLKAPKKVMQDLVCYLRRERKHLPRNIKAYIESNLSKLDYSYQLDMNKLDVQGKVFNLQQIYDDLNQEYFGGRLNLHITWFGKRRKSSSSRLTFGLYHDPLKLIKINRIMDNERFPLYMLSYIIYHEMLHYVCPAYVDERGVKQIHSKAFKERERKFRHFGLAQKWIKDNQQYLFNTTCGF